MYSLVAKLLGMTIFIIASLFKNMSAGLFGLVNLPIKPHKAFVILFRLSFRCSSELIIYHQ